MSAATPFNASKYPTAAAIRGVLQTQVPSSIGNWCPLPGFKFSSSHAATDDPEFLKFFISSFLRLYAVGVQEMFGGDAAELEFVLLCKFRQVDETLRFQSYAPWPKLNEFMMNAVDQSVVAQLPALLNSFTGAIEKHCAFPNDVWVPVAVVYNPLSNHILFSNINQLESGDQFLKVGLTRTTSGYLNYLGTLMFRLAAQPKMKIEVANLDNLLGKGMDPFIRWIHHAAATGIVFDSDRVFVNVDNPEEYDFKY
ncbi:MAG: hypothetical protein ABJE10_01980 [bacterium]